MMQSYRRGALPHSKKLEEIRLHLRTSKVIQDYERTLRELDHMPLRLDSSLSGRPRGPEEPQIDVQIEQAVQELGRLKAEYVHLRTKQHFMKTLLTGESLDDLPTSQGSGRAEVRLQEEKRRLRKIKAERAKAEKGLAVAVGEVGNAHRDAQRVGDEAYLRLRQARKARKALKASEVEKILQGRDFTQLESLVEDIDELDAGTCRKMIKIVQEDRAVMERSVQRRSAEVERMRVEVDELETDVSNLTVQAKWLRQRIASEDQRNPRLAQLRHELMLRKEVGTVLTGLTGIRVSEVCANGASLELNAWSFVPCRPDVDRSRCTSRCTHSLHIGLDERESGEAMVTGMVLEPADISVADMCT